jgi:putative DNA primase/helicase
MEKVTREEAEESLLEKAGIAKPEDIFKTQGQVKFYLVEQPIFYDANGLWWIWVDTEKKWKITDDVDILNAIEKITGEDIITPKSRTLITNSLKQECRKTIPMPIEPTWIQFKDKIYDIKTGNCFDASPDYFVTNPIPWKLHNNNYEETPIIDKIFTEWVGEKFVRTLYEIVAYCLLPSYPLNRMFCFLGAGMNGKSKFLELLRRFVGAENVCSTELDTLLASRFEVTRLHKKLVCQMGETNFNEMQKTSIIKKLTGGDLMGFEYKNKTPFEDKNYAKIIIATNNLPTTTDKTLGFYRRWLIVDFPNIFSEQKDILEDIPDEEYESLALKCTGILHNLLKNRRFTNEGSVEERMERYEAKADFLQKFLDEFTIETPDGSITCSDFAKKFSAWCFENRHRQMADNTIGKKMKEKSIEKGRKYASWLFDGKGGQIWVWEGRKWKE